MIINKQLSILTVSSIVAALLLAGCNGKGSEESTNTAGPAVSAPANSMPDSSAKLSVYTPAGDSTAITTCNIEVFDTRISQSGPVKAKFGLPHRVAGWIAAPHLTSPTYWLRFEDKMQSHYLQTQIRPSISRSDVVATLTNESMPLLSGFKQEILANALPVGNYHMYLVAVDADVTNVCDNGRQLNIE